MADEKKKKKNNNSKHWFKELMTELKKVTWLTPKQLVKNTAAVITMVLIVAFLVFIFDSVFNVLNEQGFKRVQSLVQTTQNVQVDEATEDATEGEEATEVETTVDEGTSETTEDQTEENNVVEE